MPYPDLTQRVAVSAETLALFHTPSTATISAQLMKRGVRSAFMANLTPLNPEQRLVGRAYTLRYLPAREDFDGSLGLDDLTNIQRKGVEEVGTGEVFVVDARGDTGAGSMGEILAARILKRGAAGIVTDGAFRDTPGIRALGAPIYCRGMHAYMNTTRHFAADLQIPVACAGVMVCPGDVLVGDGEGVIVVPQAMAAEVARDAAAQEMLETFIREQIDSGASIRGVYPPNAETLAAFAQWKTRNE